uniref:ATP synthase F0 subunit 8 n=1 Tax=Pontoscolex corethrurus TaxID=195581 RepID=A0A1W5LJT4_9ANNE|nr:ATP synthase F0 subunit 8 [Pontoscolex corethrurus]ANJ60054.1 ATP synthase F0 subunit 8 [Pontoscolex corethrurus]
MPHLSPMSWLIMLLSMWLLTASLSQMAWWKQPHKMTKFSPKNKYTFLNQWSWT